MKTHKMKRLVAISFVVAILLLATLACQKYETTTQFFNGGVVVEYRQTTKVGQDDVIKMAFYDKGQYDVAFSYTKGTENSRLNQGAATLPINFTVEVLDDKPLNKEIRQNVIPGFLSITITHGDVTESHDFK